MERYVFRDGKKLRCGFTTGACAAAAAKAATVMLVTGEVCSEVELSLHADGCVQRAVFPVEQAEIYGGFCDDVQGCAGVQECAGKRARCGVRKDSGDDIDVTDGIVIFADVSFAGSEGGDAGSEGGECGCAGDNEKKRDIIIDGGDGIGRVTKKGLDQKPGSAAINSGPREMIRKAVIEAAGDSGMDIKVIISAPEGSKAAEKTFNPQLGIEGGISILGTTGIVEPMSLKAVSETVKTEIRVKSQESDVLVIVPGKYGEKFASDILGADPETVVKCSNFIGDALDAAAECGTEKLILAGNLGKFVKLAGGIFDTHSRNSDCRMDIIIRCALEAGAENSILKQIDECVTTDAAVEILNENGMLDSVMEIITEKAAKAVRKRFPETELYIFSNRYEILGHSLSENSEVKL